MEDNNILPSQANYESDSVEQQVMADEVNLIRTVVAGDLDLGRDSLVAKRVSLRLRRIRGELDCGSGGHLRRLFGRLFRSGRRVGEGRRSGSSLRVGSMGL